jgi:hypothetical protein
MGVLTAMLPLVVGVLDVIVMLGRRGRAAPASASV